MSKQISVKEALRLISIGEYSSEMEVTFEGVDGIEALDAVALGEAGVDVPENLIHQLPRPASYRRPSSQHH